MDGIHLIKANGRDRPLSTNVFPEEINFSNYLDTINAFPFGNMQKEHLVYHGVSCVRQRAFKLIYRLWILPSWIFQGEKLIFSLVLSTMMIPGFVTMIPQYVLFSKIGWVGTYLPLIIPSFFFLGMPSISF